MPMCVYVYMSIKKHKHKAVFTRFLPVAPRPVLKANGGLLYYHLNLQHKNIKHETSNMKH